MTTMTTGATGDGAMGYDDDDDDGGGMTGDEVDTTDVPGRRTKTGGRRRSRTRPGRGGGGSSAIVDASAEAGGLATLLLSCSSNLPLQTPSYAALILGVDAGARGGAHAGFARRCVALIVQVVAIVTAAERRAVRGRRRRGGTRIAGAGVVPPRPRDSPAAAATTPSPFLASPAEISERRARVAMAATTDDEGSPGGEGGGESNDDATGSSSSSSTSAAVARPTTTTAEKDAAVVARGATIAGASSGGRDRRGKSALCARGSDVGNRGPNFRGRGGGGGGGGKPTVASSEKYGDGDGDDDDGPVAVANDVLPVAASSATMASAIGRFLESERRSREEAARMRRGGCVHQWNNLWFRCYPKYTQMLCCAINLLPSKYANVVLRHKFNTKLMSYGFHGENGNGNWFPLWKMETETGSRFVHFPRVRVCLWSIVKKIIPPKKCG